MQSRKDYRDCALADVSVNGGTLYLYPRKLRGDRDIVLAAVTQNGIALRHASDNLRADREVVLKAISQSMYSIRYASSELMRDREILFKLLAHSDGIKSVAKFIRKYSREFLQNCAESTDDFVQKYIADDLIRESSIVLSEVMS